MTNQKVLGDAWQGGMDDRFCVREQAKAWALREVESARQTRGRPFA